MLKEQLEIELTQADIKMKGESFYTEFVWEKIFKIDEQKNWFLIYLNSLSAITIPKKDFREGQIEEFKKMLATIPNIPIHLKANDLS
ncbi:MAG TPA: YcxB family protein [Puia sp.]|nr:YcxB family protein [Puia sp.]